MKRIIVFIMVCLSCILLCACEETIIEGSNYGKEYRIDKGQHIIEYDHNIYRYEVNGDNIKIITPLGNMGSYTYSGIVISGSSSEDDFPTWEVATVIGDEVIKKEGNSSSGLSVIMGVIMIVVGLINALVPDVAWQLKEGWKYRNAEPSDMALILIRLGGIGIILFGILALFVNIFES